MKKIIMVFAFVAAVAQSAMAQTADKRLFNHVAVGVEAGTAGLGVDVAVPATKYLTLRAGIMIANSYKYNTQLDMSDFAEVDDDLDLSRYDLGREVDVEAKLKLASGKFLVDIYPFTSSSFHVSTGLYFGGNEFVSVENTSSMKNIYDANQEIEAWNRVHPDNKKDRIGVELGDYFMAPDSNGKIHAAIQTKSVRPYLGMGFGRTVPKKRLGLMLDAGVQFWGTPKLVCNGEELTAEKIGGDSKAALDILSKITIFPTVSLRICGRIL